MFDRILPDDAGSSGRGAAGQVDSRQLQAEWLDYLQTRRETLIMELRAIDAVLVEHGRLRYPTLPKRVR